MKIIDGKQISEIIKDELAEKISKQCKKNNNNRPNLAIILVGNNEDSKLYVNLKEKEAKKIGIDTHIYKLNKEIKEQELIELIEFLNNDNIINAILIQLPLPAHIDTNKIIKTIKPEKDADGFHPENLANYLDTKNNSLMPPVYAVVAKILEDIKCDLKNKNATIIANSDTFGKNLGNVLKCLGANIIITDLGDDYIYDKTIKADILISAVGKPHFIKEQHIKKDAIIIDIGITKINNKIMGDIDSKSVQNKASHLTPVPGGVGPITIAMLFKNTLRLFNEQSNKN